MQNLNDNGFASASAEGSKGRRAHAGGVRDLAAVRTAHCVKMLDLGFPAITRESWLGAWSTS